MRDNDVAAFRLLLDRYEGAVQDRINQRAEYLATHHALSDVRRRNDEYAQLVQELDKALRAAKAKKRPKLPAWHVEKFKVDDDIPF